MMYGHVDSLGTGSTTFADFDGSSSIPGIHGSSWGCRSCITMRPSTWPATPDRGRPRADLAVTALARVMLHDAIPNIQVSWVKLGPQGCARLLRAGANDLGGTLMEETISRMAGSEHGSAMTPEVAGHRGLGRAHRRERTTCTAWWTAVRRRQNRWSESPGAPRARADSGDPEPIR